MPAYWMQSSIVIVCFEMGFFLCSYSSAFCTVKQLTSEHGFHQRIVTALFDWCKHWGAAAHLSLVLMCLNMSALLSARAGASFGAMQIYQALLCMHDFCASELNDSETKDNRMQEICRMFHYCSNFKSWPVFSWPNRTDHTTKTLVWTKQLGHESRIQHQQHVNVLVW